MMLRKLYLILVLGLLTSGYVVGQSAVNSWKDYLNYTKTIDVDILGDDVYVAAQNTVFIYHQNDNSFDRLNVVSGLSDIGISLLRIYPDLNLVFIGYSNGNIDIISDKVITNFADIKNSSVVGDKSIRDITFSGNTAYISTGVGILDFDIERTEIKDAYTISAEGALSTHETCILNDTLYAATNDGLYKASLEKDLTIFSNWTQDLSIPDPFGEVLHCAIFNNKLYINQPNANLPGLYRKDGSESWVNVLEANNITYVRSAYGSLTTTVGYGSSIFLANGSVFGIGGYGNVPAYTRALIVDENGIVWISDNRSGLVKRYTNDTYEFIYPDGPATNSAFDLDYKDGVLWVASGAPQHPGNWNNNYRLDGFYHLSEGTWKNITRDNFPELLEDQFFDVCKVYIDPDDSKRAYVGSYFSGFYQVDDNEVTTWYNTSNSSLLEDPNFIRPDGEPWIGVAGFLKDEKGNLWVTNPQSASPLCVKRENGQWENFDLNGVLGSSRKVLNIIEDDSGYLWMIVNGSGLVVANPNDESGTLESKKFTAAVGAGGLASNEVYCISTDLDGELWVGTANGISVFYSPFDVFSDNPSDSRQILVEQDGNYQYLLESQSVSSIAIDGANRKWIGTFGSGVFLMSEDGTEEIQRYTSNNSPLISDMVNDIVINQSTGEVFIATDQGIVSVMSDATVSQASNSCSKVYPNPVREHYSGPISITGLVRDSEVRITDAGGNLVNEMVSNGGTAIWDGRNLDGIRVATGVYFALVADVESGSKCVTKILVVK